MLQTWIFQPVLYVLPTNQKLSFYPSEISNLLVMTKNREPVAQRQPQVSQLSFHRILKEEIVQVIFYFIYVDHLH